MFLGFYPFILGYPICWHAIGHISFLQSFVFLRMSCNIFSFISDSECSLLLSCGSHKGLPSLLFFSKDKFLVSLVFFSLLLSVSFTYILIFVISFLLLIFTVFSFFFSSSWRHKVRLFIWDFFIVS